MKPVTYFVHTYPVTKQRAYDALLEGQESITVKGEYGFTVVYFIREGDYLVGHRHFDDARVALELAAGTVSTEAVYRKVQQ